MGMLILREFIQVTVPMQFALEYFMICEWRPAFNDSSCTASVEESRRALLPLFADLVVELLIFWVTCMLLRRGGFAPIAALRGLVATQLPHFMSMSFCAHAYFLSLQHSHVGMDLSFRFPWLSDGSRWRCGLKFVEI